MISIFAFTNHMIYKYIKCHELLIQFRKRKGRREREEGKSTNCGMTFPDIFLFRLSQNFFLLFLFCCLFFVTDVSLLTDILFLASFYWFFLYILLYVGAGSFVSLSIFFLFSLLFCFLSLSKFTCSSNKCNILCWFCFISFPFLSYVYSKLSRTFPLATFSLSKIYFQRILNDMISPLRYFICYSATLPTYFLLLVLTLHCHNPIIYMKLLPYYTYDMRIIFFIWNSNCHVWFIIFNMFSILWIWMTDAFSKFWTFFKVFEDL